MEPPCNRPPPTGTPVPLRRCAGGVTGDIQWEVLPLSGVAEQTSHLPAGARVTVTCAPARGIDPTVDLAVSLAGRGFVAVPHLAARQIHGHGHLTEVLDRLAAAGVDEAFVVGGDATEPAGPFTDGLTALEAMASRGHGLGRLGVPAYPEGHDHIDDETLWQSLKAKQAHADYIVTQMCFDSAAILLRISRRIGIGDSLRFLRGNRRVMGSLVRPGGYRPDELLRGLADRVGQGCDLSGLHVYTFNRVAPTVGRIDTLRRRGLSPQG
ncbi:MAG: methylenetetrahydrofolate reductase [Actinobacteria bacterium QS_5_72_10]|nr:MAG: methylenetetrahydrofolate reductase [Actinobacteria bacterium QS_5_72_10]